MRQHFSSSWDGPLEDWQILHYHSPDYSVLHPTTWQGYEEIWEVWRHTSYAGSIPTSRYQFWPPSHLRKAVESFVERHPWLQYRSLKPCSHTAYCTSPVSKVEIEFCYPQDENHGTCSAPTFGMVNRLAGAWRTSTAWQGRGWEMIPRDFQTGEVWSLISVICREQQGHVVL